jgi:hypothetical protein
VEEGEVSEEERNEMQAARRTTMEVELGLWLIRWSFGRWQLSVSSGETHHSSQLRLHPP